MAAYGMHEAKTNLSRLVNEAAAGEDVVIQRNGKPVARLVAVEQEKERRLAGHGAWEGKVWMADDFDDLPEGWAEAFGYE
jgi:prevent-host-death family protein